MMSCMMLSHEVRLVWQMCLFEAQRFRTYPLELFASVFARLAETALYVTFWLIVSQLSPGANISTKDIVSYYLIMSGIIPFFNMNFGVAAMTIDHIKSGELSQTLLKPISPIVYPWATRTGRSLFNYLVGVVQIVAGMLLSGGLHAAALPFLPVAIFNAFLINAAFNIMIGAIGFYFIEARGIKNMVLHVASFARGEKMPLHYMPPALFGFLMLTPFPASQYHVAILLQGSRLPTWGEVLIGTAWAVGLVFAAVAFWRHALRRYEATGL